MKQILQPFHDDLGATLVGIRPETKYKAFQHGQYDDIDETCEKCQKVYVTVYLITLGNNIIIIMYTYYS